MINLALFGAGRIGSIHAANARLHPAARLVALHDPMAQNADRLAAEVNCKKATPDEIFADDTIDAVLICSATDTHADLIERAADAGKHVFCEKPIDLSLERVKTCYQRLAGSPIKTMIGFNRRFDPNFRLLRERIDAGDIGAVELVSIISKDPAPPPVDYIEVSGGLFRDMTIHDFDMAGYLLDDEVVSVSAQASCLVDGAIGGAGDVDTAVITLAGASGKLAQISNSRRASFGYDQRIEVHGAGGMLSAGNVNEHTLSAYTEAGVTAAKPQYFFLERYAAAYRDELDCFLRLVQGESIRVPAMQDGLNAMLIAEAANLSLQQARVVGIAEVG